MKKRPDHSTAASALQITLSVTLMAISAILFASNFRAAPQVSQEGFYPPLPIQRGGLTSDPNWNVSANIIGAGTLKTLRVSAFMSSFTPLAGGPDTLFFLRVQPVAFSGASSLTWAPVTCVGGSQGNEFVFIDDN